MRLHPVSFLVTNHRLLGMTTLIVTNASGGLSQDLDVGDLVILKDHVNMPGLAGNHPLRGPNAMNFGDRFPPLIDAYSLTLRCHLFRVLSQTDIPTRRKIREGIYAFVGGPSYETPAEARLLHMYGCDVVGMSTVPEVVVARHMHVNVLAISLVTNKVSMDSGANAAEILNGVDRKQMDVFNRPVPNHDEVVAAANAAARDINMLVHLLLPNIWTGGGR